MVQNNTPVSPIEPEEEEQEESQYVVDNPPPPNASLPSLVSVSSRFGNQPPIRGNPLVHAEFVRRIEARAEAARYALSNPSLSSIPPRDVAAPPQPPPNPDDPPMELDLESSLVLQVPRLGFFVPRVTDLGETLNDLRKDGYELIVVNVARKVEPERIVPICDLLLSCTDWITHAAAYINTEECINTNSPNFPFLDVQLNHAAHLSLRDIIIQCPEDTDAIPKVCRVVNARMQSGFVNSRIHFHLPIQARRAQVNLQLNNPSPLPPLNGPLDSWLYWNQVRSHLGYDRRIGVALELDGDLPDEDDLNRWRGEAVSLIIVPFILFLPTRNYAVRMPDPYADFISSMISSNARQISIVIKGHVPPPIQPKLVEYMSQFGKRWVSEKLVDEFAIGYEDYLQVPLQPLADNLEASTYEIFEKDPIKYDSYRQAMVIALSRFPKDQRVVVLLVGAGRGPLIRCSLAASEETGRLINLYAIEKNACAAHTLQSQEWVAPPQTEGTPVNTVTVINTDIRDWIAPELADIVISELLGSFSDNELSPECLDGAWRCVKPEAISIPESYRSYIQPIMSHRLYTETLAESVAKGKQYTDIHFVTHMKSFFPMAQVCKLFEFVHRDLNKPPTQRNNARYQRLNFKPHTDSILHGFAGYFDTTLIEDITLSIVPQTHTPSLISWFPTWIPLSTPVKVTTKDVITLDFWRNVSRHNVWYEWCLHEPVATRIQNPNGVSYSVGLNS